MIISSGYLRYIYCRNSHPFFILFLSNPCCKLFFGLGNGFKRHYEHKLTTFGTLHFGVRLDMLLKNSNDCLCKRSVMLRQRFVGIVKRFRGDNMWSVSNACNNLYPCFVNLSGLRQFNNIPPCIFNFSF